MLVLRRHAGESFLIGDDIEVRVLEVAGKQVKVGIIAPREIVIRRTELAELNRKALLPNWRNDNALEDLAERLRSGSRRSRL